MKPLNLTTVLLIAIAVLVTLQLSALFRGSAKPESMIRNEVELEHLRKELPGIKEELATIQGRYDSLLMASGERLTQLENKKQPIYNAIKNVRSTVADLDKEQLRRELSAD
jgi:hypothetical protein